MNLEKITIVVPFYNANEFIGDLLKGINNNHNEIFEVIFIYDNGSETPKFNDKDFLVPVKVFPSKYSDKNGAGLIRAYGYELARSRFVMFLDPDDYYIPDVLKQFKAEMIRNNYAFAFGGVVKIDEHGAVIGHYTPKERPNLGGFLKKKFTVYCVASIIDKSKIPKLEYTAMKKRNDYFMWYHVLRFCEDQQLSWGAIPMRLVYHRLHSKSLTSNIFGSLIWYFILLNNLEVKKVEYPSIIYNYIKNTFLRRILHKG